MWYQGSEGRYKRFPFNLTYTSRRVRVDIGLVPTVLAGFRSFEPDDVVILARFLRLPLCSTIEHIICEGLTLKQTQIGYKLALSEVELNS